MKYALILTHNRPELLQNCVSSIGPQVDRVIVIDNASEPPVQLEDPSFNYRREFVVFLTSVPDQPPNLAKFWNIGIDIVNRHQDVRPESEPQHIAFLCDDTVVPPGWFNAVTEAMTAHGAAAGCSNPWDGGHGEIVKTAPDSDITYRMPGWAWILDTSKGLRADERLHWWWCDTDMDWKARRAGGMVMISGYPVHNIHPNEYTVRNPELSEQAGKDGQTFQEIWGWRPW